MCLAAVALTGCGPAFEGSFFGTLITAGACSDGSNGSESENVRWTLVDNGDRVIVSPVGGTCGSYNTTPDGDRLVFASKACPGYSGELFDYSPTLTSGHATLDGDVLDVDVLFTVAVSGAGTGTCTLHLTGTLFREQD